MFYYLYQITNNVNGKIYVGVHKAKSMDDGYMGSGKVIKSAIKKHGLENFTKVILETFENAEAMYAREKEVVNDEFLLREDVYNLRRGGSGGWDYLNKIKTFADRSAQGKRCHEVHPQLADINFSKGRTSHTNKKSASTCKEKYGEDYFSTIASYNKTKEHCQKISEALKGKERTGSCAKGQKKKIVICPHCAKEGAAHVMFRWHFEKCKLYPGGI